MAFLPPLAMKGAAMKGCMGLLAVASLIYSSVPSSGSDLPPPREAASPVPAQSSLGTPAPYAPNYANNGSSAPNGLTTLPPGGMEATVTGPAGQGCTIVQGTEPALPPCPTHPLVPPLTWTCLHPPAPAVVDCRSGAWQQVYVSAGPSAVPAAPVAPDGGGRVGIPRRCCLPPPLPNCCPQPCSGLLHYCFHKRGCCP